jgi:hypothetical protein
MRHLKREIRLRQAMVLEDRQLLAAHADALRHRALRSLASPKALLGGFGAGFAAAMLRGRRKHEKTTESSAAGPQWLQLLLREVAVPLAMGALQAKLNVPEQEQQE